MLVGLLNEALVSMERPAVFVKALEYDGSSSLDFVNTLFCAYHGVEGKQVLTFDQKLKQFVPNNP